MMSGGSDDVGPRQAANGAVSGGGADVEEAPHNSNALEHCSKQDVTKLCQGAKMGVLKYDLERCMYKPESLATQIPTSEPYAGAMEALTSHHRPRVLLDKLVFTQRSYLCDQDYTIVLSNLAGFTVPSIMRKNMLRRRLHLLRRACLEAGTHSEGSMKASVAILRPNLSTKKHNSVRPTHRLQRFDLAEGDTNAIIKAGLAAKLRATLFHQHSLGGLCFLQTLSQHTIDIFECDLGGAA